MGRASISSLILHGEMSQEDRNAALEAFRNNEKRLMVATDVSARGIDIPDVTHVINYDLPDQADNYVHRVGRTGRGANKGIAYTFCSPEEHDKLRAVEAYTGTEIKVVDVDRAVYRQTKEFNRIDNMDLGALMEEVEETLKRKKKKK
jgi:ATP-dependent RNA helicase RhlE